MTGHTQSVTLLAIDSGACTGHGRCYDLAESLFDDDDRGYGRVVAPVVPAGSVGLAQQAVHACPEGAITLGVAAGSSDDAAAS